MGTLIFLMKIGYLMKKIYEIGYFCDSLILKHVACFNMRKSIEKHKYLKGN